MESIAETEARGICGASGFGGFASRKLVSNTQGKQVLLQTHLVQSSASLRSVVSLPGQTDFLSTLSLSLQLFAS